MLKHAKFSSAVFKLLVGRLLDIEKSLKIVKISSFIFNFSGLVEVFGNSVISISNNVWGRLLNVIWAVFLELHSIFSNLNLKFSKSILNVRCFLGLKWKNCFLNWTKSSLTDFNKSCLRVLKLDGEVLSINKLHSSVLLKEINGGFHWSNLIKSSILDHLDISQVTHNLHEERLVFFSLGLLWKGSDTSSNIVNEVLNVLNLLDSVVKKEIDVSIDPENNSLLKGCDQWGRVDSQPSNINR